MTELRNPLGRADSRRLHRLRRWGIGCMTLMVVGAVYRAIRIVLTLLLLDPRTAVEPVMPGVPPHIERMIIEAQVTRRYVHYQTAVAPTPTLSIESGVGNTQFLSITTEMQRQLVQQQFDFVGADVIIVNRSFLRWSADIPAIVGYCPPENAEVYVLDWDCTTYEFANPPDWVALLVLGEP